MEGEQETGPVGWLNWRRHRASAARGSVVEFAVYSDAHLTGGNFTLGPYEVINAVGSSGPVGNSQMGLVLRVADHLPNEREDYDWSKTDTADYHGGGIADEIAALFSLGLGIRCRASGMIRTFEDDGDRYGRVLTDGVDKPFLAPPHAQRFSGGGLPMIPAISRTITLEDAIPFLEICPRLSRDDAVALLRAARGYEEAVWAADGDPQLAWLRLIGSVESAALRWSKVDEDDPRAALEAAWPELFETIDQASAAVAETLIREIAPLVKSSKRFRDFLLAHLPPPPATRPEYGVLDWNQMPNHLRAIYTARSKALHAGTPFPIPMIDPPRRLGQDNVVAECMGTPVSSRGAVWLPKDAPMHLHVFAYIAGEAHKNRPDPVSSPQPHSPSAASSRTASG
jgi:hypothetical protein